MGIRYLQVVFFCLLLTACSSEGSNTTDWKLIWSDEFTEDGSPDIEKWGFSPRWSPDWARYCTESAQTTFIKDGHLYLRSILNASSQDTVPYNTGCIQTKGKFSFKYGKVEVRAKLPEGKGAWPAIWMMPQHDTYGSWPRSGEIDIMEHLNADSIVYQTVHSSYINLQDNRDKPPRSVTTPIKPGKFNIYGIEWTSDQLIFFVNGHQTLKYPKIANADSKQWPFDQPFYLVLNQALGGSWVGSIDDKDLPVEMVVDWVRIYEKRQ